MFMVPVVFKIFELSRLSGVCEDFKLYRNVSVVKYLRGVEVFEVIKVFEISEIFKVFP